ncbi:MAG: hypothetical protein KDK91_01040 [Gammaproteobacteria bacterium]|nr:hypothetical protein [Gammaproteobacteria bacterium]
MSDSQEPVASAAGISGTGRLLGVLSLLALAASLCCLLWWLLELSPDLAQARQQSSLRVASLAARLIEPLQHVSRAAVALDPASPDSEQALQRAHAALDSQWRLVGPEIASALPAAASQGTAGNGSEPIPGADARMSQNEAFTLMRSAFERQSELLARLEDLELRSVDTAQLHAQAMELIDSMVTRSETFLSRLARIEAEPAHYEAASLQLVLTQRLRAQLLDLRGHDEVARASVDAMGREAVQLGELNTRLRTEPSGPTAARIEDQLAEDLLSDVGQDFRNLAELIEPLANDVQVRRTIASAADELGEPLHEMTRALVSLSTLPAPPPAGSLAERFASLVRAEPRAAVLSGLSVLLLGGGLLATALVRRRDRRRLGERLIAQQAQLASIARSRAETVQALNGMLRDIDRVTGGEPGAATHPSQTEDTDRTEVVPAEADGLAAGPSGSEPGPVSDAKPADSPAHMANAALQSMGRRWAALELDADSKETLARRLLTSLHTVRDAAERESTQLYQTSRATYASAASVETVAHYVDRAAGAVEEIEQGLLGVSEMVHGASRHSEQAESNVQRAAEQVRVIEQTSRELNTSRQALHELEELARLLSMNAAMQSSSIGGQVLDRLAEDAARLADAANEAAVRVALLSERAGSEAVAARTATGAALDNAAAARQEVARLVDVLSRSTQSLDRYGNAQTSVGRALREHMADVADVVRAVRALNDQNRELGMDLRAALSARGATDGTPRLWSESTPSAERAERSPAFDDIALIEGGESEPSSAAGVDEGATPAAGRTRPDG